GRAVRGHSRQIQRRESVDAFRARERLDARRLAADCGMFPARVCEGLEQMASPDRRVAIGIFALITTIAPIAFGAVDRSVQIVLVALLAAGFLFAPPEFSRLSRRGVFAIGFVAAFFVVKEFAPAICF